MKNATHIATDQNWMDETTIYWFDVQTECSVDGDQVGYEHDEFGIAESPDGATVVDANGAPIDYNDCLRGEMQALCIVTDEMRMEATQ